jgi:isorenieratene synthase
LKSLLKAWVRRRLRGYREVVNDVDPSKPLTGGPRRSVAVVGGGLAGIAASALLGERGFNVTLFDKNPYLGGKVGSWAVEFADGFTTQVDHGFHAFFRHYYNLARFLSKTGSDRFFRRIDDYLIIGRDRVSYGFADVEPTPVLNILSLAHRRFFSLRDVVFKRQAIELRALLQFDRKQTFKDWDGVSYDEFAARASLPAGLKLVFSTFARAFFAPGDRLSVAELMKSFHFFYLSNDCGLLYDYLTCNYKEAFLDPVHRLLSANGVSVELGTLIERCSRRGEAFIVNGREFHYLVLAADVTGVKRIANNSTWLREYAPELHRQLTHLEASLGYAVLRLWLDKRVGDDLPVFVTTEKQKVLDSITFYHQFDREARKWSEKTRGGVYELHCYAVPPELAAEAEVRNAFLEELYYYLPELAGARIVYEHLQLKRDFTAFHCNLYHDRPWYETSVGNLYLAGDWVKLPVPAMLMEAAFTSGLLSANRILASNGLREEAVLSVPCRGIFARKSGSG